MFGVVPEETDAARQFLPSAAVRNFADTSVPAGMDTALQLIESGQGRAGVELLVRDLNETRTSMTASAWRLFARWAVTHPIARYVHADPFTHRAFIKPRGYAGDAVMMDYIYGFDRPEPPEAARDIARFTNDQGNSAQAVRYRRQVLADAIDSMVVSRGRNIGVTALAAGHLREISLSTAARQGLVTVTAIDQDEESLDLVAREYGACGAHPVVGSVRSILSGKLALEKADLVYSAGLYDYLTQPVAHRLTHWLFDSVAPGGTLLLANFLPSIPDIGYMESFMDWHLIYRDDRQMRALADSLPVSRIASIRQFHDPLDAITFLEVTTR